MGYPSESNPNAHGVAANPGARGVASHPNARHPLTRGHGGNPALAEGVEPVEETVERTLGHIRTLDAGAPEAAPSPALTLEDLYRQHRMRMVRLAVLLVDDPATAEDVVQEAFTGLHRHWGQLRDAAAAVGYLRTAVVNGSRSVLRRRKTARDYTPPHATTARSAESLAMLTSEHQAVVAALGQLPPRQREVLVLRYYGGLSELEIAEATGISRGTVKSTASRALDALQKIMAG